MGIGSYVQRLQHRPSPEPVRRCSSSALGSPVPSIRVHLFLWPVDYKR